MAQYPEVRALYNHYNFDGRNFFLDVHHEPTPLRFVQTFYQLNAQDCPPLAVLKSAYLFSFQFFSLVNDANDARQGYIFVSGRK